LTGVRVQAWRRRSSGAADRIWTGDGTSGPLGDVRVVDLGQYLAGPLVGTLLADQGADVIRVERPGGPRWDGPANALLLRNRRTIELDLGDERDRRRAQALMASADVVIENFRPGVSEALGVGPAEMRARAPHLVYCSLPGFGSSDPRSGQPAWEGVVLAAAGAYGPDAAQSIIPAAEDAVTARPSQLPLASVFAAIEAALGVVAALVARDRDGLGQWIEVPLFDAVFEAIGLRALTLERNKPAYHDFGSGLFRCADGRYVSFIGGFHRHLRWLIDASGPSSAELDRLAAYENLVSDPAVLAALRRELVAVFASRPALEWERLGLQYGFPVGMLRTTEEWMVTPHATESGTLVDSVDELGRRWRVPGPAVVLPGTRVEPARRSASGLAEAIDALVAEAPDVTTPALVEADTSPPKGPPLAGVRVLEQSRVVAAPTAAKLLAQLGADVIKLEEDPASFRASFPMPFAHVHLDRGKRTIVLDLRIAADRRVFDALAAEADVYIQNFTLGAAERLGIDDATVRRLAPSLIYLYLNANGRTGPWAPGRGYADLANVLSGICGPAVRVGMPPSGSWGALHAPPWTYTDYAAGVLGAFGVVAACYGRGRTGHGAFVETSLLRAAAIEQVLDVARMADSAGRLVGDDDGAAESPVAARDPLQRIYATADGAVFVGARADQAQAVLQALGADGENPGEVAMVLAAALRTVSTQAACSALLAIDVGAHPVLSVEDVMQPGAIADQRGLRQQDVSAEHGTVVMPGPVIRFSRTPMHPGAVPGPFGCDGDNIRAAVARGEAWRA
jgi:crotonobetainyl-CoA:carnitine CoA-transferase CaiB-like acyl-CoA transferase